MFSAPVDVTGFLPSLRQDSLSSVGRDLIKASSLDIRFVYYLAVGSLLQFPSADRENLRVNVTSKKR